MYEPAEITITHNLGPSTGSIPRTFAIGQRTLFLAPNAGGKTVLIHAAELALCGKVRDVGARMGMVQAAKTLSTLAPEDITPEAIATPRRSFVHDVMPEIVDVLTGQALDIYQFVADEDLRADLETRALIIRDATARSRQCSQQATVLDAFSHQHPDLATVVSALTTEQRTLNARALENKRYIWTKLAQETPAPFTSFGRFVATGTGVDFHLTTAHGTSPAFSVGERVLTTFLLSLAVPRNTAMPQLIVIPDVSLDWTTTKMILTVPHDHALVLSKAMGDNEDVPWGYIPPGTVVWRKSNDQWTRLQ